MTRMRAVDAIVLILEKEGATETFGLPGAAINPLYSAMKAHGGIRHTLARHVEGASHMADGFTRSAPGNIGVCLGTSGPAGTDMITGLYAAAADSQPILCITGQAPVAVLDKEDFQAVDIASIAEPVTKMAKTVLEAGQVPGVFQTAFQLMRSARPGPVLIDLPIDVQQTEIEFDIDAYEPLTPAKPAATSGQARRSSTHRRGGIRSSSPAAESSTPTRPPPNSLTHLHPVSPTLMGWGAIPDDHDLQAGMVGIQTHVRYGNASFLESDLVIGIGNRWANRHTGALDVYRNGRTFVHIDIEATQIGRVFAPDLGVVSDAGSALDACCAARSRRRVRTSLPGRPLRPGSRPNTGRRTSPRPIKPRRVYQEMNRAFSRTSPATNRSHQIAGAQMLHARPRHWINADRPDHGWTGLRPSVGKGKPGGISGGLSGDTTSDRKIAVGAQHGSLLHVVVNNSYLGLIRQSQRGFDMDYEVSLAFENINSAGSASSGYGVDHVAVAQGLGCKALRVEDPELIGEGLRVAKELMDEHQVPVVVEVILERVTNISMGTALDAINEFETLAQTPADAPTALTPMGELAAANRLGRTGLRAGPNRHEPE